MGETRTQFKVYGANGQAADSEAVVDTGATFSKIPGSIATKLGLEAKYETEVELGDGRVIKRKLALADLEIEGVRRPALVAIGEEERPSIGYTAMEILGFKVNPITRKLEKAMPIEYREKDYLSEYKDKNILITGGAGCIGSNLTKALIKAEAAKIIVLDDLSAAERWNIPDDPRVAFIQGSVLDEEILKRTFSRHLDFVFHLAAHFANQNSVDNPETDLLVNGLGTLKVLEYSHLSKVSRFVFASSGCSVYGSQAPLPLKEDFVSLHLDTPYQITKLLGELYCNFFYNYYGLPVAIARYFNVYGPGEIPGAYRNVIPNFIWWALHKKPLPVTGTGEETRDFTYVENIVDGTLRLGVIPGAIGDAFNLASETETKVIDVANMVNEITGNPNGVQFVSRRDWDKITRRRASIEKARKVLGYEPKMPIDKGIKRVYEWIVSNRDKIEACARF
jgi:nucleoside-diphosphate-sugar epimerase/predicted aspartyl protease